MAKKPERQKNMQSAVSDYKSTKRLIHFGVIAICVILLLLAILLVVGWDIATGSSGGGGSTPPSPSDDSFTVELGKADDFRSIGLSESRGFSNPVNELNTKGILNAWNITLDDIPVNTIDNNEGGSKNGQNYFAYTFFFKNLGTETLAYNELITITENKKDAVKAIRIMIYRDGVPVIYAAPAADGSKEEAHCDEAFTGEVNLMSLDQVGLEAQQIVRYTVVVWFEGNDPECVDDILGGTVKLTYGFKIIG